MNKTEYIEFISTLQNTILNFIENYQLQSACKLPQNVDDDINWTINLGELFGNINILIESWKHASVNDKVNVCMISMYFQTYRDTEKLFLMSSGCVNPINGRFILRTRSNTAKTLLNDFNNVLELLSYDKEKQNTSTYSKFVSLN